jgi:hypothetical protein
MAAQRAAQPTMSATPGFSTPLPRIDSIAAATSAVESSNLQWAVIGVNYLLQKSFETHADTSVNTVLQLEQQPRMLHALCDLLDLLNPATVFLENELDVSVPYHQLLESEHNGHTWNMQLVCSTDSSFKVLFEVDLNACDL